MGNKQKRRRYRLNARGKAIVAVAVAVAALLVLTFSLKKGGEEPADPSFLMDVQTPGWIDVQYIDMGVNARKGTPLEEINGVVVHYVANPGTSAAQNRSYFNNAGTEVNSHFIVGLEGEIIQCVPLYEQSVASNERNRDTISIEVCHPDESGQFTQAAYDSLARLTAWLCAVCGLDVEDVIRHYDVTGKLCPKYFVEHEDAWELFKKDVAAGLEEFSGAGRK